MVPCPQTNRLWWRAGTAFRRCDPEGPGLGFWWMSVLLCKMEKTTDMYPDATHSARILWRGRTRILWRGLGSQIPRFWGTKGCERSVWVVPNFELDDFGGDDPWSAPFLRYMIECILIGKLTQHIDLVQSCLMLLGWFAVVQAPAPGFPSTSHWYSLQWRVCSHREWDKHLAY